jgi:hypothetical protein
MLSLANVRFGERKSSS